MVFGNIVLPTETASTLSREVLGRVFDEELGVPPRELGPTEPLNAFPAGLPAALVARALGLGGAAYTLDAACGSSLYSLKLAVDELQSRTRRRDAVRRSCRGPIRSTLRWGSRSSVLSRREAKPLRWTTAATGWWSAKGRGCSCSSGSMTPLAHGDHIYGVVAGIGLSNDIHGDLLAPSSEGQLRAMRMAYEQAGWRPSDVDLVECHATGTPVGDAVEVESLKSLWGESGWKKHQCAIGSVKSNIGHALTAAGAAGLLKVLLALKNETLAPDREFRAARAQPGPGR